MKSIGLTHSEWDRIFAKIRQDYADTPSVYLIREKMRNILGFTYREHEHWRDLEEFKKADWHDRRDRRSEICIDFYSESAKTMFILRYMHLDKTYTD